MSPFVAYQLHNATNTFANHFDDRRGLKNILNLSTTSTCLLTTVMLQFNLQKSSIKHDIMTQLYPDCQTLDIWFGWPQNYLLVCNLKIVSLWTCSIFSSRNESVGILKIPAFLSHTNSLVYHFPRSSFGHKFINKKRSASRIIFFLSLKYLIVLYHEPELHVMV
jgi:hypothetical protein